MVLSAVTAVAFLAALLIGFYLLWFYRRPILAHLGKPGMTLLVLVLASFFLVFVLSMAMMVSRLLMFPTTP
jgi:predicted benzoate:H+ symporter BenE